MQERALQEREAHRGGHSSNRAASVWYVAFLLPALLGPPWAVAATQTGLATELASVGGFILMILLVVSSYTDVRWQKIPNWATYTAFLWALAINLFASLAPHMAGLQEAMAGQLAYLGPIGIGRCLWGAGICLVVTGPLFYVLHMGGGDVKLAVALGALLGPERALSILLWCAVAAFLAGVGWSAWTQGLRTTVRGLLYPVARLLGQRPSLRGLEGMMAMPVPMGVFFAVGALLTFHVMVLP